MKGPCVLFVALTVCNSIAKPLGSISQDELGISHRFRRSLPVNLPFEPEMLSYMPPESSRNEPLYPDMNQAMLARLLTAYPQEELLAQALERMGSQHRVEPTQDNLSLHQLLEEGHRRDKETLYLANLLHLWNQINQARGYSEQVPRGPMKIDGDFPRSYQDYDETGLGPIRPQVTRSQMAQALSHYRQDGGYEGPSLRLQSEEPNDEAVPMDEDMLRYLMTRVLSAMSEVPQRLPPTSNRRMRRAIDDEMKGDLSPNLLRVKRLDDELDSDYATNGLLRRKRIDGDLDTQPKHFSEHRMTERLLKYLPD
ncbi:uncharacterized protein LOC134573353 [Pelobates fuscus]|uniref:uncharacterized protein LOC134573353 n=1 Tax=Pelobates fuscus TaxID=191477 RepID=UPI002FE4F6C4